ncbi:MAG: (2Fe-2S)-binding protein [Deltaproteobacteria bacterium]|nr:(2Fe-2S)-binding protein [Deltaproteobacteria bacterium]
MQKTITVTVNEIKETHRVQSNQTLLSFLRETLDLTGAKEGCNEGECGACVVLLDGKAINSCMTLAVEVDGHEVTTIEGIGNPDSPHPLQQAFLKNQAIQCGFCTPGTILTALCLLAENPNPTEQDVREALAGNLCRCTGYRQIIDSVLEAASILQKGVAR